MAEKEKKRRDMTGLFIPAGLFIGMGIGFLMDALVAWMFIGLGVGFLAMVIAQLVLRGKK
ncbi:hypothetical protein KY363_01145 [Candidatus Woesearchaeota archaeon]|nr:hypothetical protein [Candidatus Woesearchaeota archaeon]